MFHHHFPYYIYGGFLKWGYPQIIHFSRMFPYKPSSYSGTPHCRKPSIYKTSHKLGILIIPNSWNPFLRQSASCWFAQSVHGNAYIFFFSSWSNQWINKKKRVQRDTVGYLFLRQCLFSCFCSLHPIAEGLRQNPHGNPTNDGKTSWFPPPITGKPRGFSKRTPDPSWKQSMFIKSAFTQIGRPKNIRIKNIQKPWVSPPCFPSQR